MDDHGSVLYQQPQAKGDVRDHNILWFLINVTPEVIKLMENDIISKLTS